MSSYIEMDTINLDEEAELPSKTYSLDLISGRIVGYVDGIDAVNQAIVKALLTPRFKSPVYDNQYGSELKDTIIAKDVSRSYINAELPRQVKDALSADTRVIDIEDLQISYMNDKACISLIVNTIYGKTEVEVVI